jgi:MFS family permease
VAPLAGRLVDRYGGGIVAVAGCGAVAATTAPFALVGATADPVLLQLLLAARGMALGLAAIPATVAAYAAVRAEQLPDATTQLNAVQRVGGAVGGALFATILARALPAGAPEAFAQAFRWLTGASALALAGAVALLTAQLSASRAAPPPSRPR